MARYNGAIGQDNWVARIPLVSGSVFVGVSPIWKVKFDHGVVVISVDLYEDIAWKLYPLASIKLFTHMASVDAANDEEGQVGDAQCQQSENQVSDRFGVTAEYRR